MIMKIRSIFIQKLFFKKKKLVDYFPWQPLVMIVSFPITGKPSILYTPAKCSICRRVFFNKYSLKRHMIQAHNENRVHTRPYVVYPKHGYYVMKKNFSATSAQMLQKMPNIGAFSSSSNSGTSDFSLPVSSIRQSDMPIGENEYLDENEEIAYDENEGVFSNELSSTYRNSNDGSGVQSELEDSSFLSAENEEISLSHN